MSLSVMFATDSCRLIYLIFDSGHDLCTARTVSPSPWISKWAEKKTFRGDTSDTISWKALARWAWTTKEQRSWLSVSAQLDWSHLCQLSLSCLLSFSMSDSTSVLFLTIQRESSGGALKSISSLALNSWKGSTPTGTSVSQCWVMLDIWNMEMASECLSCSQHLFSDFFCLGHLMKLPPPLQKRGSSPNLWLWFFFCFKQLSHHLIYHGVDNLLKENLWPYKTWWCTATW